MEHVETGHLLKWVEPDFYLPDFDLCIEMKPSGLVGNDAMRIGLAYLKGEQLEVWGKATLKMLEKAFKNARAWWFFTQKRCYKKAYISI